MFILCLDLLRVQNIGVACIGVANIVNRKEAWRACVSWGPSHKYFGCYNLPGFVPRPFVCWSSPVNRRRRVLPLHSLRRKVLAARDVRSQRHTASTKRGVLVGMADGYIATVIHRIRERIREAQQHVLLVGREC